MTITIANFLGYGRILQGSLMSSGLLSLGVPGVPWHTQILADQLTLFQPEGTDYAHLITTGTPGFSDLPTAKVMKKCSTGQGYFRKEVTSYKIHILGV